MAKIRHKRHDALVIYPHHRKPYRVHHLASLLVTVLLVVACVFELGVIVGRGQHPARPVKTPSPVSAAVVKVRSGYGFSFKADGSIFSVSGAELGSDGQTRSVTGAALATGRPLTLATVKVRPGMLQGQLAAAELSVRVNPDAAALTAAEQQQGGAHPNPQQAAAKLFPVSGGSAVSTRRLSGATDTINGVPVYKTVYEFTGNYGGKSYAIQWNGVIKGRAFAVELDGLAAVQAVPGEFDTVLNSLDLSSGQAVLGASTDSSVFAPPATSGGKLDSKYLSDALSPGVVQIFHTVCGILTIGGQKLGGSNCVSFGGSGFLVTDDGYIATNGHVVVYTAKDALADMLVSSKEVLQAYLQGLGMNQAQVNAVESNPAAIAALIAKVYDLPDSELNFSNEGDLTQVALGTDQPNLDKLVRITTSSQLAQFKRDTDSIKQADTVAYNYNAKDTYTDIADPKAGFSSSDVALLKVDTQDAPIVPIETDRVVQNENIVVMGFPGDANNELTDNQQTAVTVTDGVVSSIRQAAGGRGTLYQSDADASHGNSGGPAIDAQGRVIGLMTYRYADAESGDAPASYIRSISDFTKLAAENKVAIDGQSKTLQNWEKGLELYSGNHYSAALKDFYKVQASYPAQRLVASYIASSKQAIADGEDVSNLPTGAIVVVLVLALGALGATVVVMSRHHALHHVYRTSVPDAANHRPVFLANPPGPPAAASSNTPAQPAAPQPPASKPPAA